MSSSNSFNVCPRCGKANALNAKYCSSCGQQLAVPQEVIVCHKCHKTNSPMASFCGACGAPLRVGAQTKICPKCHKEVDANENVCSCGYSFGNVKYASPEAAASVAAPKKSKSGARWVAFFSLLLVLVCYLLPFLSVAYRPEFLIQIDGGLLTSSSGNLYGDDVLAIITEVILEDAGAAFEIVSEAWGTGGIIVVLLICITEITLLVQFFTYLVRIFSGRKNKRKNLFYLIMAILATLWVGVAFVFNFVAPAEGFIQAIANVFTVGTYQIGYMAIVIPVQYWLFFFISLGNRSKKAKEAVA